MKNRRIFFPTDFSSQSIAALKETIELNKHLEFELLIFHSYSRPYSEGYDQKGQLSKLEKKIDTEFGKILSKIPELKSQKHSFHKALGDTIDEVVTFVEKEQIGLIVMSTKGAAGIGELFGTKTAKIIKSVSVPVLIVPKDAPLLPVNSLGLACDYSEATPKDKLDFLIYLSTKLNVAVDLITLNRDEKTMTKVELQNRENLLATIKHLSVKVSFTKHDHLSSGLILYAKDQKIGMVGIIPKSYNFMERLFHESLTQDMAFHSPVPVLVLQ